MCPHSGRALSCTGVAGLYGKTDRYGGHEPASEWCRIHVTMMPFQSFGTEWTQRQSCFSAELQGSTQQELNQSGLKKGAWSSGYWPKPASALPAGELSPTAQHPHTGPFQNLLWTSSHRVHSSMGHPTQRPHPSPGQAYRVQCLCLIQSYATSANAHRGLPQGPSEQIPEGPYMGFQG